ncbi:MAG: TrmH family RNA methyltransferase [Prolixibacteraceae bacterium]
METNSVVFFNASNYSELNVRPIIAAWQIINPENIGNLIRLADNVGATEVYILGEDFRHRLSSIKKTAGLSFGHVQLRFCSSEEFFQKLHPEAVPVAIETSADSTNIFQEKLPENIVFLLGNERNGLPDEILEQCAQKVHIPMTGKCKSMNVSHALAVALFEWQRQMLFS